MRVKLAVACALLSAIAAGCGDDVESLKVNVGKNACNKQNGAFAGKILNVTRDPVNRTDTIVYQVQRPESRATYAPADNVTVTSGKCPDGQP